MSLVKPIGPSSLISRPCDRGVAFRSAPAQNATLPAPVTTEHPSVLVGLEAQVGLVQRLRGRPVDGVAAARAGRS